MLSGTAGLAPFSARHLEGPAQRAPACPWTSGTAHHPGLDPEPVRLRGGHCGAGGCVSRATCEVHHTRHKANGGHTRLTDCVMLCQYHHQVVVHRLSWNQIINPDGTTTAWNKDKTKVCAATGRPPAPGSPPGRRRVTPGAEVPKC